MSEKALIFNIQKFSIHDGPGIRTVVFFKGCPLKCLWCSNPESQRHRVQILWDPDRCTGCHSCVRACPQGAVLVHDRMISVMYDECRGCRTCVKACPEGALKAEGKLMSVDEVMEVCLQDLDFYLESGGGVTLSGGEAMTYPEFACELLTRLKEKKIHTAIETTGYVSGTVFSQTAPLLDLLLFDIKHWDEIKHLEGTGVSNSKILRNLKWAVDNNLNVLPRLPVIPGYNDSAADAEGFIKILKNTGLQRIQLLPFHQFGEKKYQMLGRTYAYSDVPALHEEDLAGFRDVFLNAGIDAFF